MRNRKLHDLEVQHYHMRCLDTKKGHPENNTTILTGLLIGFAMAVPMSLAVLWLIRHTGIVTAVSFVRARPGRNSYPEASYSRADSVQRI